MLYTCADEQGHTFVCRLLAPLHHRYDASPPFSSRSPHVAYLRTYSLGLVYRDERPRDSITTKGLHPLITDPTAWT